MGNHGRAQPERQALERACRRGHPEAILHALRDMHWLKLATITDDAEATIALAQADDPRWRLAGAQLLAAITRALRLDLDGVDEVLTLIEGLPDTAKDVLRLAGEAGARTAGPPA